MNQPAELGAAARRRRQARWRSACSTCSRSGSGRRARTPSARCGPRRCSWRRWSRPGCSARWRRYRAELYGSLGATGHGHGSMPAIVLGLRGEHPETVDPASTSAVDRAACGSRAGSRSARPAGRRRRRSTLTSTKTWFCTGASGCLSIRTRWSLPRPTPPGGELSSRTYYSVGGGFVLDEDQAHGPRLVPDSVEVPYPFSSGAELLARAKESGLSISGVMLANELARPAAGSGGRPPGRQE